MTLRRSLLVLGIGLLTFSFTAPEWGFFGHRRLNRLAVFTLDPDMMPFFRANLEFLTEHAVDPDKRRYASPFEAVRHYIDIDHWGESEDFAYVPRRWTDALLWKSHFYGVDAAGDTLRWRVDTILQADPEYPFARDSRVLISDGPGEVTEMQLGELRSFYINNVLPNHYENERPVMADSLRAYGFPVPTDVPTLLFDQDMSEYGILPWHLESMQRRLTRAFRQREPERILRLCAEMGHYLGDAHVPLHTTENYNGQMTGQTGIHAFWESRLPELFADAEYDFYVGKARYLDNPRDYFWEVVLKSHSLVDSVLNTEARLRETFPEDQQMVFDERLGRTVKTQSAEFADAWDTAMQGMVEERFRAAIRGIGSVWYTAWVDAGQPELDGLVPGALVSRDTIPVTRKIFGRKHE